jgi:hypothetical protein
MNRATANASTAPKCIEVLDLAGNVVARFESDESSPGFREWLRNLDSGLSAEELQRRINSRDGFSTEQVLAKLRSGAC